MLIYNKNIMSKNKITWNKCAYILVGQEAVSTDFGIWRVALTLRESENTRKSEKKKQIIRLKLS